MKKRRAKKEPSGDRDAVAQEVTEAATPAAEAERSHKAATDVPDDASTLRQLQQTAGNQAVGRTLKGEPLPSPALGRMEEAFGRPLGEVRIHSDEVGEKVAGKADAPAAAEGRDIYFAKGAFKPDTPVGEALLAHELAHVVHSHGAGGKADDVVHSSSFEAEANRTAFAALSNLWLGTRELIRGAVGGGSGGRGSLLPGDCPGSAAAIEAPDYLGEHSRETLASLNSRLESLAMLGPLIAVGTATAVGFGPPSDPTDTVTSAAQALAGLPAIKRHIITQEVTLLLVNHENDMNEQERAFWRRILDAV